MAKRKNIIYSKFYSNYIKNKIDEHQKECNAGLEYLMSDKKCSDTLDKIILNEIKQKDAKT